MSTTTNDTNTMSRPPPRAKRHHERERVGTTRTTRTMTKELEVDG
jgi:hypothetical protein